VNAGMVAGASTLEKPLDDRAERRLADAPPLAVASGRRRDAVWMDERLQVDPTEVEVGELYALKRDINQFHRIFETDTVCISVFRQ
jgi:hypothetical protein